MFLHYKMICSRIKNIFSGDEAIQNLIYIVHDSEHYKVFNNEPTVLGQKVAVVKIYIFLS